MWQLEIEGKIKKIFKNPPELFQLRWIFPFFEHISLTFTLYQSFRVSKCNKIVYNLVVEL
ncbi:hypothetical protein HPK19_13720 [Arthrobacter citreus]|nr:hypothetical protein HPK19_13720 [Arthrobacter citreus]